MRIIVAEFEKSGGSWLTSMLADSLGIPARDLYHDDNFKKFDLTYHPWYINSDTWNLTESCVIKSHEPVGTRLHNFPAHTLHMMRDGRDVVVSRYFFARDFCVKNGLVDSFTTTFEDFLEVTARDWAKYVTAWCSEDVLQVTYESVLADPVAAVKRILGSFSLNVSEDEIKRAVEANTKEKFSKKLDKAFAENTFVRKGISGDWVNHFSSQHKKLFKINAGKELIAMGYEKTLEW